VPIPFRYWRVAEPAPDAYVRLFPDLHPLVVQVLYNRKLSDPAVVADFLSGHFAPDDPFLLRGMEQAVARLRRAIGAQEPIAVYGDFDADGVTATALLVVTLRALGGQVLPYIPHRVDEGYGLHCEALSELAAQGVRVVVTVDCGVRSLDEVAHARRLGMDVIVTDHHQPGARLPEALAVIDPRQPGCSYPYPHLAGVGLAYKLAQALLRTSDPTLPVRTPDLQEEDLLDLVALGTVADLAPLTGENRALVIRGLQRINTHPRPGVEALVRQAGLRAGSVNATVIGYVLGPRLNAAGRIAHADIAYRLLTAEEPTEAEMLAQQLDELNRERQRRTLEAYERAREMLLARSGDLSLLFLADADLPSGVAGLVASRLAEEFYRPAVIVERGEDESRGSARSIPEFHITRALDACADLLIRHGGHAAAGGFTCRTHNLPELQERLQSLAVGELGGRELSPCLHADAEVHLREMDWRLGSELQRLQPFGEGNAEPLFVSRNVEVRYCRAVGADGVHLKMLLSDGRVVWDSIAFRQGEWADKLPDRVDVAYHLQFNEWNGERRLQLNVQDIRPAGWEEDFA
jgi:single-stranded-DNA-specific exonuclease